MGKKLPKVVITIIIIIGVLGLIGGLSIFLYPTISNYFNTRQQKISISEYVDTVDNMDNDSYKSILSEAEKYNADLFAKNDHFDMSDEELERYSKILNVSGDGIMAYVEIPAINCSLPVYHGTDDSVLQVAIGHIDSTSVPVGGANTHCVISAHRGLSSAKLFSELDRLVEGDIFTIQVLDKTLTYEVDQITVVLPDEADITIVDGEDYCTLVTCTPYGINTHRLLVRGHRITNPENLSIASATADAVCLRVWIIIPVMITAILILWVSVVTKNKKKDKTV